jgi:CubicO group peptidase (beta-lactamase class C family)
VTTGAGADSAPVRLLERHVHDGAFAGAALVVWKDGTIVTEAYVGDAAPQRATDPDVLWPVASISKVYTAAAIMRLVEEGVLTLSTPVCLVLPDFTGGGRQEMRVRHLLTHTAGFMYESPEMEARLAARTPMRSLIAEALRSPLLFAPGTELRYADYNYLIAAHVAESAAGRPFVDLMRTLVLEPAGLAETFFPPRAENSERIAIVRGVPAEGSAGEMYNSDYARTLAHPAFGIFATARDLNRFGTMFMPGGPRFLSDASVRAMTTDQTGGVPGTHPSMKGFAGDVKVPWAIGFALQTDRLPGLYSDLASSKTFGHGGASGCELVCDPEARTVIALTTNTHLRTGREAWTRRVQSVLNAVFASLSRPE